MIWPNITIGTILLKATLGPWVVESNPIVSLKDKWTEIQAIVSGSKKRKAPTYVYPDIVGNALQEFLDDSGPPVANEIVRALTPAKAQNEPRAKVDLARKSRWIPIQNKGKRPCVIAAQTQTSNQGVSRAGFAAVGQSQRASLSRELRNGSNNSTFSAMGEQAALVKAPRSS